MTLLSIQICFFWHKLLCQ